LESLARQTLPVHEVIVADAGSADRTREVALDHGASVVEGGLPGVGRNKGAEVATGEWILFVDADVRLPCNALEVAFQEMARAGLHSASTWFVPDSDRWFLRLNHWLSCLYFRLSTRIGWPHSIGAFLLLSKEIHERVGGFDPSIPVAEDQDYVRRIAKEAPYGFLRHPAVEISVRRFANEGSLRMSLKWFGIELHRLLVGEVRSDYFRYFKRPLDTRTR
jgi:glycosyltransferase involved in cell wall biosynthesis